MVDNTSLPNIDTTIIDLDENPSGHKMKRANFAQYSFSFELNNENFWAHRKIITSGDDLEDSVVKLTQNVI